MVTAILLTILLTLIIFLYYISTRKFNFWKKRNVPYIKPTFLLGNYGDFITTKEFLGWTMQKLCKKFPNEPYFGAFFGTEPVFIAQDPELIKLIMTKDYPYFSGREVTEYCLKETSTSSLFFASGDRWKVLRQNLSPLFTIAKMKNMFHLIEKCAGNLDVMMEEELKMSEVAEIRSLMTRYTMDCICSTAFGVDTNTMKKDSNENPFKMMGEMIFEISTLRALKDTMRLVWPGIFYGIGMRSFPLEIDKFFNNMMSAIFDERRNKPSSRNDFVDIILAMKTDGRLHFTGDSVKGDKKVQMEMSDQQIVSICIGLFAAGFETSATTLSFGLYELAKNQETQAKALEEVDAFFKKTNGAVTYDCVTEVPYIEAVMEETIRLYPVLSVLTREVMEDYTLPTGVTLEKGLRVHLPIYHLNHNPEFFEDPEVFRPERLLGEEKARIKPYTFMPFGEGPRICIGLRLAKMQVIAGFITILRKYRVSLTEGTPPSLRLESRALVTQPKGGIRLRFIRRDA